MLKFKTHEKEFSIDTNSDGVVVLNDKKRQVDIVAVGDSRFHLLVDNQSFEGEVVDYNYDDRVITVKLKNQEIQFQFQNENDLLLERLGLHNLAAKKAENLKAPMPGLVVSIDVNVGDTIAKGDNLLVLEAMKMENIIKASTEGKVKAIKIEPGQAVEKNQELIVFE